MIFLKVLKRLLRRMHNVIKCEYGAARSSPAPSSVHTPPQETDFPEAPSRYPLLNARYQWILNSFSPGRGGRPHYAWGALCGADLANQLGFSRISLIEFGVAGGAGLVTLEAIAEALEKIYPLKVEVYGFDSGKGLPAAKDARDLPQLWSEGFYPMDVDKLKSKLTRGRLMLGEVHKTLPEWMKNSPAPVAFIIFDLDRYSSTMEAFRVLEGGPAFLLPRVPCFFDDIMGYSYGDCNGERLAITDFNAKHEKIKISPVYGLKYFINEKPQMWMEQAYLIHALDHPLYGKPDGMVTAKGSRLDL